MFHVKEVSTGVGGNTLNPIFYLAILMVGIDVVAGEILITPALVHAPAY